MKAPRVWMPTSATRSPPVALHDLVGDPHERPAESSRSRTVLLKSARRLASLAGSRLDACPFLASLDRVKGTDGASVARLSDAPDAAPLGAVLA